MNPDERQSVIDELCIIALKLDPTQAGPFSAKTGNRILELLKQLSSILNHSGKYEHALQRGSDVQEVGEALTLDFRCNASQISRMVNDLAYLRIHAGVGPFPGINFTAH